MQTSAGDLYLAKPNVPPLEMGMTDWNTAVMMTIILKKGVFLIAEVLTERKISSLYHHPSAERRHSIMICN